MIEPTNVIIAFINLFSLILGGITLGLILNLSRRNNTSYLNYYFFFLISAVIAGLCDWIIFNWVLLLVPGITSSIAELIYHILWDLIGLPAALFALFFLIKALNGMLKIHLSRLNNVIFISLLLFISILSYVSFYFRLLEIENILRAAIWTIFTYIIPVIKLLYLAFAYYKSVRSQKKDEVAGQFILLLFFSFLLWHVLSLVPFQTGVWKHLIIFIYYLALFLPAVYLFIKREDLKVIPEIQKFEKLEDVFRVYNFTPREKELVALLLEGKSNKEISEELFISLQTVKNYISKIYKKIGLKNRIQFVNFMRKYH